MDELRAVKDGEDKDEIQKKTEATITASMKLGEAIYKEKADAEGAAAAAEDGADAGPGDDGVVDADFEEVGDDDEQTEPEAGDKRDTA